MATARLGTAAALGFSLPFAKSMGGVSASIALGAALLCAGVLVYLVYCVMDKKEDASAAAVATEPEEGFKFSDLGGLFKTTGFWYVAFLCLMFYAGVFPFLKFATKLMIFKYGVDANLAGLISSDFFRFLILQFPPRLSVPDPTPLPVPHSPLPA